MADMASCTAWGLHLSAELVNSDTEMEVFGCRCYGRGTEKVE